MRRWEDRVERWRAGRPEAAKGGVIHPGLVTRPGWPGSRTGYGRPTPRRSGGQGEAGAAAGLSHLTAAPRRRD